MHIERFKHTRFSGIVWRNTPMYHFLLEDINDFRDFEINVDVII